LIISSEVDSSVLASQGLGQTQILHLDDRPPLSTIGFHQINVADPAFSIEKCEGLFDAARSEWSPRPAAESDFNLVLHPFT
jgi:hypothetical protein